MRAGTVYRSELFRRIGVHATGERVLDVGAFDGQWITTQDAAVLIALDLDVQPRDGCQAVKGDALNLPFPNGAFDSVFAFDVIEHVGDDRRFVKELVRVTKPGGRVTMTTPAVDLRIFPGFLTQWAHRRWGHDRCTGYEALHLSSLLEEAGVASLHMRELRAWGFLNFYLPLSALARVSSGAASLGLQFIAACDARWGADGRRGYLLAEAMV
jgi:SAM-dependent methyltransferase